MSASVRIVRTRNRHSRAVIQDAVLGNADPTIEIRLAKNLSRTEEQRHIDNLLRRMQAMIIRERRRTHLHPSLPLSDVEADAIRALVHRINEATLRVSIKAIRLRAMRTQWGSCSSRGNITLNTALLNVPRHLLEYVIIHELAHRKVPNHSKAFWNLVESACPGAKEARRELRNYRLGRTP